MPTERPSVLAPSDLSQLSERGFPLVVGGRVVARTDAAVVVADAISTVTLPTSTPLSVRPGDLVELLVDAPAADGKHSVLSMGAHYPANEPTGRGEHQRIATGRGTILAARSRALAAVRAYFETQRFVEVETPTFVPCPGLDPHVHSLAEVRVPDQRYHLITSPEFHMKRLLVGGLPRIFQIARCFRAEELGDHHEPEFTLIEWYRAFSGYREVLLDTENLIRAVFDAVADDSRRALLGDAPFRRLTIREAFARLAGVSDAVELCEKDPDRYFELLIARVEPGLAAWGEPVFLTHYPRSQAALARLCPDDPTVAERFELYLGGVELCNGFGELTDTREQRKRFDMELARRAQSEEPIYPLDERFLDALAEGMPPSAGNALGFDRLVALATGTTRVRETLAFSHSER